MAAVTYGVVALFGGIVAFVIGASHNLLLGLIAAPLIGSVCAGLTSLVIAQAYSPETGFAVRSWPMSTLVFLGDVLRQHYIYLLSEPFPDEISRPLRALA